MPAPQFFTPGSVHPSTPKRRFTVAQANRTLPLVQRVVGDIVKTHEQVVMIQESMEDLDAKGRAAAQSRLDACMNRLEDFVDELSDVGCDLKDHQTGLIDFIGRHQGRDVCLCWKLGEEKVSHWHELNSGFAGRQPVESLEESE